MAGQFEVLARKSRFDPEEGMLKAETLPGAVRQARRWLYANGLRGKSSVKVYDSSGLREFSAEVDTRGRIVLLWSRTREAMGAFHFVGR